jgi:hypothetical protein
VVLPVPVPPEIKMLRREMTAARRNSSTDFVSAPRAIKSPTDIRRRGLGNTRYPGTVTLVKRVMGNKTVFSHEASERKDLDVIQVLIDLPDDFSAPLGLQVDVDIRITEGS